MKKGRLYREFANMDGPEYSRVIDKHINSRGGISPEVLSSLVRFAQLNGSLKYRNILEAKIRKEIIQLQKRESESLRPRVDGFGREVGLEVRAAMANQYAQRILEYESVLEGLPDKDTYAEKTYSLREAGNYLGVLQAKISKFHRAGLLKLEGNTQRELQYLGSLLEDKILFDDISMEDLKHIDEQIGYRWIGLELGNIAEQMFRGYGARIGEGEGLSLVDEVAYMSIIDDLRSGYWLSIEEVSEESRFTYEGISQRLQYDNDEYRLNLIGDQVYVHVNKHNFSKLGMEKMAGLFNGDEMPITDDYGGPLAENEFTDAEDPSLLQA